VKTLFVGNHENEWLMQGAIHHAEKHIPDLDVAKCYTPADVTKWSESLGKCVEGMDEDYLLLMLDDYWVQSVDAELLRKAEVMIEDCAKVDLSGDRLQFRHSALGGGFVLSSPDARYLTSLQAAIWKKDHLLKFCREGWTPWDFEIEGSIMSLADGATILGTDKPCIRYINVLRRGEWHGQSDF